MLLPALMDFFNRALASFARAVDSLDLGVEEWLVVILGLISLFGLVVALAHPGGRRGAVEMLRSVGAVSMWGTGVRLLSIERPSPYRTYATLWVTILYFPLLPIVRHRIEFVEARPGCASAAWIRYESTGLVAAEVLRTYLYGYVLLPALIVGPMVVGWLAIVFVPPRTDVLLLAPLALLAFGILWLAFAIWRVIRWDEDRKRPCPTSAPPPIATWNHSY